MDVRIHLLALAILNLDHENACLTMVSRTDLSFIVMGTGGFGTARVFEPFAPGAAAATSGNCRRKLARRSSPGLAELLL